jgi:hypothetical protein
MTTHNSSAAVNTLAIGRATAAHSRALVIACLAAASAAAWAAPVVVTPGSLADKVFQRGPDPVAADKLEKLVTCYVTPTADDKTIVLSTRNWNNYTKPITVFYKVVGGGAARASNPRYDAAGGSSAILKNGSAVAVANGMNAGATSPNVVSGSFTFTSSDTLRFVAGGGGGAGAEPYYYADYCWIDDGQGGGYTSYQFHHWALTGGGGAGYFGGGAGAYYESSCAAPGYPPVGAAIATGGTGIAGGIGVGVPGSANVGGYNPTGNSGYPGGYSYGGRMISTWNGYGMAYWTVGAGGNKGQPGQGGGTTSGGSACPFPPNTPAAMPLATTYDLHPTSGQAGSGYSGTDAYGYSYNCAGGGGRGQIVLQYQAKTCDLIPQYDKP